MRPDRRAPGRWLVWPKSYVACGLLWLAGRSNIQLRINIRKASHVFATSSHAAVTLRRRSVSSICNLALLAFNHVGRGAVGAIILRKILSCGAACAASDIPCNCTVKGLTPAVRTFRSASNTDVFHSASWAVTQHNLVIAPGTSPCKNVHRAAYHHLVDMLETVSPVPSDISIAQSVSSDQLTLHAR